MKKPRIVLNETVARRLSKQAARQGATFAGIEGENILSDILTGPRTGRIYRRGGVVHQASAPGEAPASDTGELRQSIVSVVSDTTNGSKAQIGTTA